MTAASNPPAEVPAPGSGCEGDNSQQLTAPRSQRTAKEPYRGCEGSPGSSYYRHAFEPSSQRVARCDIRRRRRAGRVRVCGYAAPVECAYVAVQRRARPNAGFGLIILWVVPDTSSVHDRQTDSA